MKRMLMTAAVLAAAATLARAEEKAAAPEVAAVVPKEESPDTGFSFEATLDLYSAYIWRGCVVNDRPVWQPGGTVSYATADYGTLSAGVWGNFDMTDRCGHTQFGGISEVDYTAAYEIEVGPVSLSAGHIWYVFPSVSGSAYDSSTREVFASAQYNTDLVNPFVEAYYDYEFAEGVYALAGVNKTVEISDRFEVGAELSMTC